MSVIFDRAPDATTIGIPVILNSNGQLVASEIDLPNAGLVAALAYTTKAELSTLFVLQIASTVWLLYCFNACI